MTRRPIVGIELDGVRELTRALAATDRNAGRQLAQANKAIGQKVLARLQPTPIAVGAGAGAKPRAVASRNQVAIKAGGAHRTAPPVQSWGKRPTGRRGRRPHIVGTGLRLMPQIEAEYLAAIADAADAAGLKVRR